MITWAEAHTRAAAKAAEIQADLAIRLDAPVDVFSAIQQLGIVLAFAPLGGVSGIYIPHQHGSSGILLHSGHPRTRQRYTAGHELGHHVFGHAAEVDGDLEVQLQREPRERWPDHEKEAEAFAAWFLMPRRLIRQGMQKLRMSRPSSPRDVYALSLWLGTSYTATVWQLSATRLIEMPEAIAWSSITPRSLKRSLAGDLTPDDMKNDVWWLDERQNRDLVEARPGDRIILTLDEIPSSGYSWRPTDRLEQFSVLADSSEEDWMPQHDGKKDAEVAGAAYPRSIVFEIDQLAQEGLHRLSLTKDRPWEPGSEQARYEVLMNVQAPLTGIQLSEQELVLSA